MPAASVNMQHDKPYSVRLRSGVARMCEKSNSSKRPSLVASAGLVMMFGLFTRDAVSLLAPLPATSVMLDAVSDDPYCATLVNSEFPPLK